MHRSVTVSVNVTWGGNLSKNPFLSKLCIIIQDKDSLHENKRFSACCWEHVALTVRYYCSLCTLSTISCQKNSTEKRYTVAHNILFLPLSQTEARGLFKNGLYIIENEQESYLPTPKSHFLVYLAAFTSPYILKLKKKNNNNNLWIVQTSVRIQRQL